MCIIHFPLDVSHISTELPRLPSEADVVVVKGKSGKMSKNYTVREQLVYRALAVLKERNIFYRNVSVRQGVEFENMSGVFVE